MLNWFSKAEEETNQRRDVRFSADLVVSCGNENALVRDLSIGGMRLSLGFEPQVGSRLSVHNSCEQVDCEIVWVKSTQAGYEAGLRYCDESDREARWFHQMLFSHN